MLSMKKFYIFLDIDGVLYDWDWIIEEVNSGRQKRGGLFEKFKPDSMLALNMLIEKLNKIYDVRLVISSTWRSDLTNCIKVLKNNGLCYNKKVEATPFSDPSKRGEQILEFLKDKHNYDFVIIDDEMFDFLKFFHRSKIIKTEMYHSALSVKQIKNYLDNKTDLQSVVKTGF